MLGPEHGNNTIFLVLVGAEVTALVALCVISEIGIRVDHRSIAFHGVSNVVVE